VLLATCALFVMYVMDSKTVQDRRARQEKVPTTNCRYKFSAYHSISNLIANCLHRSQYRHKPSEQRHKHSMKYTIILAALSAYVAAQTVDDLPACSVDCLTNGMSKAGCDTTDTTCACSKAEAINEDITPCIERECSSWDDYEFRYIVTEICYNAGVPIQEMSSSQPTITSVPILEASSSQMMHPHMRHSMRDPCRSYTMHAGFVSLTLM
jgi:hypothetical protein